MKAGLLGHEGLGPRADIGLTVFAIEAKLHATLQQKSSGSTTVVFLLHYGDPRDDSIQNHFICPSALSHEAPVVEGDGATIQDRDKGMLQAWVHMQDGIREASAEGIRDLGLVHDVDLWVAAWLGNPCEWLAYPEIDTETEPNSGLDQLQANQSSISSALCATSKDQLLFTAYLMLVEANDFVFSPQRARTYVKSYFDN